MNAAVVLSGGSGVRMGDAMPKQYLEVAGKPILVHTLLCLQNHGCIDSLFVVAADEWKGQIWQWKEEYCLSKLREIAPAGADRQLSIRNGLLTAKPYMAGDGDGVLIQDAVRPLTSCQLISKLLLGLQEAPAVMPVVPVTDTVYSSQDGEWADGLLERSTLYAGQAPEAFHFQPYLALYQTTLEEKLCTMSGSCQLPQSAGWKVKLIPGERENIKITVPLDRMICEKILDARGEVI